MSRPHTSMDADRALSAQKEMSVSAVDAGCAKEFPLTTGVNQLSAEETRLHERWRLQALEEQRQKEEADVAGLEADNRKRVEVSRGL